MIKNCYLARRLSVFWDLWRTDGISLRHAWWVAGLAVNLPAEDGVIEFR